MREIRRFLGATLVGAALALMAIPAAAQMSTTQARVEEALQRTDQRIETAAALLAANDNSQADLELDAARGLQSQARGEYAGGRLRTAMDLTLRARGRADRAIALVKGLPDPDRVLTQLERTRDVIERARDRTQDCQDDRVRALLKTASDMQERAEAAARESRYLAALQLTLGARERAFRALRVCHQEDDLQSAAQRALQRTDQILERAREVVDRGDSQAAHNALSRAQALQRQAEEQFRSQDFAAALRLTTNAAALARRALRLSGQTR